MLVAVEPVGTPLSQFVEVAQALSPALPFQLVVCAEAGADAKHARARIISVACTRPVLRKPAFNRCVFIESPLTLIRLRTFRFPTSIAQRQLDVPCDRDVQRPELKRRTSLFPSLLDQLSNSRVGANRLDENDGLFVQDHAVGAVQLVAAKDQHHTRGLFRGGVDRTLLNVKHVVHDQPRRTEPFQLAEIHGAVGQQDGVVLLLVEGGALRNHWNRLDPVATGNQQRGKHGDRNSRKEREGLHELTSNNLETESVADTVVIPTVSAWAMPARHANKPRIDNFRQTFVFDGCGSPIRVVGLWWTQLRSSKTFVLRWFPNRTQWILQSEAHSRL